VALVLRAKGITTVCHRLVAYTSSFAPENGHRIGVRIA